MFIKTILYPFLVATIFGGGICCGINVASLKTCKEAITMITLDCKYCLSTFYNWGKMVLLSKFAGYKSGTNGYQTELI